MKKDDVDHVLDNWAMGHAESHSEAWAACTRILLLAKSLGKQEQKLLGVGITLWQVDVLAALRGAGPPYALRPTQIRDFVIVTSGAMTTQIDKLEKLGLVRRSPDRTDRRSVLVALTAKGLKLVEGSVAARVESARRALNSLTVRETQSLATLLRKMMVASQHLV